MTEGCWAMLAASPAIGLAAALTLAALAHARSLRRRTRAEVCAAVEAAADAVDRRVWGDPGRGARVAERAGRLARALGLPRADVARVRQAARARALGRLAAPDAPADAGPLDAGGDADDGLAPGLDFLGRFPEYAPCLPLVRASYGRPAVADRLAAAADDLVAPRPAAILALADAFEALTAPIPARPALTAAAALAALRAGRGGPWDPALLDALAALVGAAPAARPGGR